MKGCFGLLGLFAVFFVVGYIAGTDKKVQEKKVVERVAKQEEVAKVAKKAEDKRKRAEEAENKRKGFHCLSFWDGSHPKFKRRVKARLNDPGSFEHIDTLVGPVLPNGRHAVNMQYRARNAFGGMVVGWARGMFRNANCEVTSITQLQ